MGTYHVNNSKYVFGIVRNNRIMTKANKIILFFIAIVHISCENSVESDDKKSLWVTPLEEAATAALTMDEEYLYFSGVFKYFYRIRKMDGQKLRQEMNPGSLLGNPIIADSLVYSGTRGERLYCLNKNTLDKVWIKSGFAWNTIPSLGNYLYVTEENKISALSKEDGNIVWSTEIIGRNAFNPVINDNNIYFVTGLRFKQDGYLYCINSLNGKVVFQKTIPYLEDRSQFGGSSAGVEVWNNYVYVPADNRNLYCFNKETGDSIWMFLMDATSETPAKVSDGIVYTGTLNRTCYAVDAITGNLVWSYRTVGSIRRIPPQFHGDKVAFISGALIICNKKNGNLIADISTRTGGKYEYLSALWDTDGKMYLTGFNTNSEHLVLVLQF